MAETIAEAETAVEMRPGICAGKLRQPSSARRAGPRRCLAFSTPSKRSPWRWSRSRTDSMVKVDGSSFSSTSSQWSGVETGALGIGRTEYTDASVLPLAF